MKMPGQHKAYFEMLSQQDIWALEKPFFLSERVLNIKTIVKMPRGWNTHSVTMCFSKQNAQTTYAQVGQVDKD